MSISEVEYLPLASRDYPNLSKHHKRAKCSNIFNWKDVLILSLLLSTIVMLAILIVDRANINDLQIGSMQATNNDIWTPYTWWSKYSSISKEQQSAIDKLWDDILPAHGVVAVDHRWAVAKGLPDTISLPSDNSKGVYIIDAYHQLHCLKIIRKSFYEISKGEQLTYPLGHSMHCFDSIRQYVICTAGDTLLYSWGRNITGDGQYRRCRNWSSLHDWASKHSACYRDFDIPVPLNDHFGHCDHGSDGLIIDR